MNPTRKLTADQKFFWTHAGYSHDPATESLAAGRTRCAVALAEAESLYLESHRVADVSIEWSDDEYGRVDAEKDGLKFETCESAVLLGPNGALASLHSILDADDRHRRVVRAELASECAEQLRSIVKGV